VRGGLVSEPPCQPWWLAPSRIAPGRLVGGEDPLWQIPLWQIRQLRHAVVRTRRRMPTATHDHVALTWISSRALVHTLAYVTDWIDCRRLVVQRCSPLYLARSKKCRKMHARGTRACSFDAYMLSLTVF
jgi:FAD/FMN-containing dehydrogenase